MASSWRGRKKPNKITKTKAKLRKKKLYSVSVQRWPVFSSSHLHIQLENKIQTRVPSYSAISESLVPCFCWGKTRAKARASRKSLHLCSPLRRGMTASLGNRKPNRAIVRRIQMGRFCLWCLMNYKEREKTRYMKLLASRRAGCLKLNHVNSLCSSDFHPFWKSLYIVWFCHNWLLR